MNNNDNKNEKTMVEKRMNMEQGHWVLAKLGKKVLRPGGKALTQAMLNAMNITPDDDVVEFAPGLGYTAKLALSRHPHSYTAVELNAEAAQRVRDNVQDDTINIVIGNASETGLPDKSASKVYGEAMLTMQSKQQKQAIIGEAARLLRPGGLYGIHEIGIFPDDTPQEVRREIESDLAKGIKTNVRPLTVADWKQLLEDNGFDISFIESKPMHLLERKRVIADEGLWSFICIVFRMLKNPVARKRVLEMRSIFRKHAHHINAICIVARKR